MYQEQNINAPNGNSFMDKMETMQSTLAAVNVEGKIGKYASTLFEDFKTQFGILEAAAWSMFGMLLVLGYHVFSDGVFSSLITLASCIQFLGMILTLIKVEKQKNYGILSINMLQLYVPIYVLRLACTLFHEGYLPVDQSGDWAYQAADIWSLACVVWLLVKSIKNPTVKEEKYFPSFYIVAGCFALACFIHPRHNLGTWPDTFWTASLYIEAFVMIPQLRLVAQEQSVESLTSHSIACTSAYRTINFYFWIVCRKELIRVRTPATAMPMYCCMTALAISTFVLYDFMFYYLKCLINRTDLNLPSFDFV